jgi:hypothetical protein
VTLLRRIRRHVPFGGDRLIVAVVRLSRSYVDHAGWIDLPFGDLFSGDPSSGDPSSGDPPSGDLSFYELPFDDRPGGPPTTPVVRPTLGSTSRPATRPPSSLAVSPPGRLLARESPRQAVQGSTGAALGIAEARTILRGMLTAMAPKERSSPPTHAVVMVRCRRGRVVWLPADDAWLQALTEESGLQGLPVADAFLVTQHGWRSKAGTTAGQVPALAA